MNDIPLCCVTGAIVGDGGACGDCDPCIDGGDSVPEPVKRLIAEKNGLLHRLGELEGQREAADLALQEISLVLGGTDEWSDQHNMISDVTRRVRGLRDFICDLDGKTICIRGEGNTFVDDGIVVASDHVSTRS